MSDFVWSIVQFMLKEESSLCARLDVKHHEGHPSAFQLMIGTDKSG